MQVTEIELYEILKEKIGQQEARKVVEYIEAKVEKEFEEKKDTLATKADLDIMRAATKADLDTMRAETRAEFDAIRAEIKAEIAVVKADIIKWMFLFWIGQLASLIAILQIFFRSH